MNPFFLITIDTEGDNLWARPRSITTKNSSYVLRFQNLCDKYKLKPTYLVDYEMAVCPIFTEIGKDVMKDNRAEIGMHLHAWNSPPIIPLTSDDYNYQPYLIEYPEAVIVEKVKYMTDLLEDTFGIKMLSHRAGRWSFNTFYANVLKDLSYKVDCSVTPYVSFKKEQGDPNKNGGTDFTRFPSSAYFMDSKNIKELGTDGLLEIPVTIFKESTLFKIRYIKKKLHPGLMFKRSNLTATKYWLRPTGRNADDMARILQYVLDNRLMYAEFMLHSSEFMPGGSPHFKDDASIDKLYDDLEYIFDLTRGKFTGATLSEFYDWFAIQNNKGKA
jgi:hypothetical protein